MLYQFESTFIVRLIARQRNEDNKTRSTFKEQGSIPTETVSFYCVLSLENKFYRGIISYNRSNEG